MTSDCLSVECCTEVGFMLGIRNVNTILKLTQCDQIETSVERKSWTMTGLDSLKGKQNIVGDRQKLKM